MRFNRSMTIASFTLFAMAATLTVAASIPVWLDDAMTEFNEKNPNMQFRFVDIKDSYAWYVVQDTAEIGSKDIREGIYGLAKANGYKMTSEEELLTTARPPSQKSPATDKKCWKRSFTLDGGTGSAGRMLTTFVCQDDQQWFTGFRILQ
jgi:hypothetical protein